MEHATIARVTERPRRSGPLALGFAVGAVILAITGGLLARKLPGPGCNEAKNVGLGTLLMYGAFFVLGPASVIAGILGTLVGPARNRALALVGGGIAVVVIVVLYNQFSDWTYWCGN